MHFFKTVFGNPHVLKTTCYGFETVKVKAFSTMFRNEKKEILPI